MTLKTGLGISPDVLKKLVALFRIFPEISKVVIYGSRARGDHQANSDIDLTLFGKGLDSKALAKIESAIDDLLLPQKVDVSIYAEIDNQKLLENIENQGAVIYERKK